MIKVGDCDVCLVYAAACCSMGVGGYSYERARFLLYGCYCAFGAVCAPRSDDGGETLACTIRTV